MAAGHAPAPSRLPFSTPPLLSRHPRIPRAGDHHEPGLQQVGGLVGARRPRLRDERRLPPVLRQGPDKALREDRRGEVHPARTLLQGAEGPRRERAPGGQDEKVDWGWGVLSFVCYVRKGKGVGNGVKMSFLRMSVSI